MASDDNLNLLRDSIHVNALREYTETILYTAKKDDMEANINWVYIDISSPEDNRKIITQK
jgi:hypothetical protein